MPGLIAVKSNTELEAERIAAEREAALVAEESAKARERVVTGLAAHIRQCFESASTWRSCNVDNRLIDCKRRRKGEYEPSKLEAIRASGGSEQYFNLTKTKCGAAQSWLDDLVSPSRGRMWALEPTPIPSLPEEFDQNIRASVGAFVRGRMPRPSGQEIRGMTMDLYDRLLAEYRQEAKERASRMSRRIDDQLTEGGFYEAMKVLLNHLTTYPVAILKGPVIRPRKRLSWKGGGIVVETVDSPTWEVVNPFDFFPAPNVKSVNDGFICELVRFPLAELSKWRDAEGYRGDAIDRVISEGGGRRVGWYLGEDTRAALEGRDTSMNGGLAPDMVEGVEFWGNVKGELLREWGVPGADDVNAYYPITAIYVGEVIHAIMNPDPLGRHCYFVTGYDKTGGELFGEGMPESMSDCQDAYNASLRNMLTNLGISSGPQVAVDIDALDPAVDYTKVYPRKAWPYHGLKAASMRDPVKFFQPEDNSRGLMEVAEYFARTADDRTGIPRYAHGNEQVGGAGETASGLSMLMQAAAKGVRRVIANLDADVLRPAISAIYAWNLLYLDDETIKGDCRVSPRGALAAIAREEVQRRRQEFLDRTLNDVDMQIIGVSGRVKVLRKVFADLDMDDEQVVPDDEELRMRVQQSLAAQVNEAGAEEAASGAEALMVV